MPEEIKEFIPLGGFIPDLPEEKEKNWTFGGAEDEWPVIHNVGDWWIYASTPEKQDTLFARPYDCVSISACGNAEKVLNKMMTEDPAVRPILEMLGMLGPDGKADISERFPAKGSGTIAGRGNSQHNVYEFIRKNGLVGEKHWPTKLEMTDEDFYSELTPEVRALGKKFLEYFTFEYKDVGESNDDLREALKRSPLCVVVGGAYLGNYNGALLYRNNGTPSYNHQLQNYRQDRNVEIFNETFPVIHKIEDSYEPFLKDYAPNYPFAFAKIIKLTLKKKPMFRLAKTASSPAVYLLCEASLTRLGVADSPEVEGLTGGTLLKLFSGTYGNAGIAIVSEEEMAKYRHAGDIQANLFN